MSSILQETRGRKKQANILIGKKWRFVWFWNRLLTPSHGAADSRRIIMTFLERDALWDRHEGIIRGLAAPNTWEIMSGPHKGDFEGRNFVTRDHEDRRETAIRDNIRKLEKLLKARGLGAADALWIEQSCACLGALVAADFSLIEFKEESQIALALPLWNLGWAHPLSGLQISGELAQKLQGLTGHNGSKMTPQMIAKTQKT